MCICALIVSDDGNRPELFLSNHGDSLPFSSLVCPVAVLPSALYDRYSPYPPLSNSYHCHCKGCFYTCSFSPLHVLDSCLTSPHSSSTLSVLKLCAQILAQLRSCRNLRFTVNVLSDPQHVLQMFRSCGEVVHSDDRCVEVCCKSVASFSSLDNVFGSMWDVRNYDLKFHQINFVSYRLLSCDRGRVVVQFAAINHQLSGSGLPLNRRLLAIYEAAKMKQADAERRACNCSRVFSQVVAAAGVEENVEQKRLRGLKRRICQLEQTLQRATATADAHAALLAASPCT